MGITKAPSPGVIGASTTGIDGLTPPASPAVAPAPLGRRRTLAPAYDHDRQMKRNHVPMKAEGQPRANLATGAADSSQDNLLPLATSTGFVYTLSLIHI